MKRRNKIAVWIVGIVAALIAGLSVFVATFDWNRAKPYINAKVSDALGRRFVIAGNLGVAWRRDKDHGDAWPGPVFTANDIVIDNPAWARDRPFAHLEQIRFRLSLLPLLGHRIVVRRLELSKPEIHLEKHGPERNNWTFALPENGDGSSSWTLDLQELVFDTGHITLKDPVDHLDVAVDVDPLGKAIAFAEVIGTAKVASTKVTQAYAFGFKAHGTYNGARVAGSGKTGGVLALRVADARFPLQADVRIGDVRLAMTGTVTDPTSPDGIDLGLRMSGDSLAHLYPILGVTLPDTPPFETDGRLTGTLHKDANSFSYKEFNGRIGGSDLHGDLTYAQAEPRPRLRGKLTSNRVQLADLGPLIGLDTGDDGKASDATPAGGKEKLTRPTTGKVLPDAPFRTTRWRVMDADVAFNGKSIVHGNDLPVSDLETHLVLDDGVLTLDPLNLGLAGGKAAASVRLDGRADPMKGEIGLKAAHLKLRELFPKMKTMQAALGEVNADVALSATGNSVAALLGSSDGELKLLMNDGVLSRELMELAGLNVGNYIAVKLFGDEPVAVNCAATDFVAKKGLLTSRLAVFDTENALINIDGTVNFASEDIDIDITPHTKGLRIFSLRSPLYIKGTLGKPDVGVHKGKLLLRGGGAVALGVFATPAAALLALIAPSKDANVDPCSDLLSKMGGRAKAPSPGKR